MTHNSSLCWLAVLVPLHADCGMLRCNSSSLLLAGLVHVAIFMNVRVSAFGTSDETLFRYFTQDTVVLELSL